MTYYPRRRRTLWDKYLRWRSGWRRFWRIVYPSPLEVRFAQIMGGKTFTLPFLMSTKTGFPFSFIWRGSLLRRELVYREVRAGSKFIDYAVVTPFYKRGIELKGARWHDIVKDQQREDYLHDRGWELLCFSASQLREPERVKAEVLKFLE